LNKNLLFIPIKYRFVGGL